MNRVVLSIAGSDSSGGAGIQADLKTFSAFGLFGTTALTAVTAQNTVGVQAVHTLPAGLVAAQIDAVAADMSIAAAKTGMLANAEIIAAVAEAIGRHRLQPLVVDPVMVAASGDLLLHGNAVAALRQVLLPLATIITPNLAEASRLTGIEVRTVEQMRAAASALADMGAQAALVKGGHLEADPVDVLWHEGQYTELPASRVEKDRPFHGTGCTLSAAIACGLALGHTITEAVRCGRAYLLEALRQAPAVGQGARPLNHLVPPPFRQ